MFEQTTKIFIAVSSRTFADISLVHLLLAFICLIFSEVFKEGECLKKIQNSQSNMAIEVSIGCGYGSAEGIVE